MHGKEQIRGLEHEHELGRDRSLRDVRTPLQRLRDFIRDPERVATLVAALALVPLFAPHMALLVFVAGAGLLLMGGLSVGRPALPMRLPRSCGLVDPGDRKPGLNGGYRKADGIFLLGWARGSLLELWAAGRDMLTHMLVLGTTGAGKTEALVSLAYNGLAMASGVIYTDPKAAPKLAMQIWSQARLCGRDDDFRVINFGKGLSALPERCSVKLTNTMNPFAYGNADALTQILASLIEVSKGENAVFGQNALSMVAALMRGLTDLRDAGVEPLSIATVRRWSSYDKMVELARHPAVRAATRESLLAYLHGIGHTDDGGAAERAARQHGFSLSYFSQVLNSLTDSYGHIYLPEISEVDMFDVVRNRRILVVLLPSLQKSPAETQNLGKVTLSAIRNAISIGLGERIEGSVEEILESLPTQVRAPFLCIVDEFGAIATPGFAEVLTQGRGLGVAAIIGTQDVAGMKRGNELEAEQMIANTRMKIVMSQEDPLQTWQLVKELAGEAEVARTSGYEANGLLSYRNSINAQIERRARVDLRDLMGQIEGEFHCFTRGRIVRGVMFHADPALPGSMQLRIPRMLKVRPPDPRRFTEHLDTGEPEEVWHDEAAWQSYTTRAQPGTN